MSKLYTDRVVSAWTVLILPCTNIPASWECDVLYCCYCLEQRVCLMHDYWENHMYFCGHRTIFLFLQRQLPPSGNLDIYLITGRIKPFTGQMRKFRSKFQHFQVWVPSSLCTTAVLCFWGGWGREESMCGFVFSVLPHDKKWVSSPCQVENSWCKLYSRTADSVKCISELVKQAKSKHSLWFNDSWVKVRIVLITSCISVAMMWCMHTYSFAANNLSSDFHSGWFGCCLQVCSFRSFHGFIFVAVAAVVKSSLIFSEIFHSTANVFLDVLLKRVLLGFFKCHICSQSAFA